MSVYVDGLFETKPSRSWPHRQACHMLADTPEELFAMADRLGLSRSWLQRGDHFDLSPARRTLAVLNGAIQVDARRMVEIRRRWREAHG